MHRRGGWGGKGREEGKGRKEGRGTKEEETPTFQHLPRSLNGIKESWRLARKILSQFKLLWFLNVFDNTLLAILYLEIAKNFCCRQR